jgi:plastocyanin
MRLAVTGLAIMLSVAACESDGSGLGLETKRLAFTVQPSTSTLGQTMTPAVQVSVHDASGAVVTSASNQISLALGLHPPGAALNGNLTLNATGGVATFSDLQITKAALGYTLTASATDIPRVTSAAFDVSPIPGIAVAIAPVFGHIQTAVVGQSVETSPSVIVTDGLGDPVSDVRVTFSISSGGGALTDEDQITDADGVATIGQWKLGTSIGVNTLLATASGLEGNPVTFTATGIAGAAAFLTKHTGDGQTSLIGRVVPEPPAVLVTDSYGNPVADVLVEFTEVSGGGSITEGSPRTANNGIASVGSWTLGSKPGLNTLRTTSLGLTGSPVLFSATAAPAVVEVRNNVFYSLENGSGNSSGFLTNYTIDTIPVGGTVTWVWVGENHNVTPGASNQNLSGTHSAPHTYSRTFTSAGVFFYRCTNHSRVISFPIITGMVGEVVVQ